MFFSYNSFISSIPNKKPYKNIQVQGNLTIDNLHIRNVDIIDSNIINQTTEDVFETDTLLLANFENSLQAGNYLALTKPVEKWRIKRKKIGEFTPKVLGEVNKDIFTYTDFSHKNKQEYEYQLYPVSEDGTEGLAITAITSSDFWGWFLSDLNNNTVYMFDMEINSDSISLNVDKKMFDNYTKFPVFRTGKRKYHTGGLSTIPYQINGNDIEISYELLKTIEDFINDDETKVLRNTKGDVFYVQTSDFNYQYKDDVVEQPYVINFKYTEVSED